MRFKVAEVTNIERDSDGFVTNDPTIGPALQTFDAAYPAKSREFAASLNTSKAAAALGRKGGNAGKGAAKVRGDSDHYRVIRSQQPRRAQLVAEAVGVICPDCGEAQPAAGGSELWTDEDFARGESRRACCACERPLIITTDSKVQFR